MASKLSAEARAAFEQYVSSEAERVDDFRRIVASRGGPREAELDLSRDSLGPLGAWLLEPVPPGPEDAWRPVWAFDRAADDPYLVGSWLPDGLGSYLMAMLRQRHPSLTWKLEDDRRSIFHGLPLLAGLGPIEQLPYTAALGNLDRARKGPLPHDPAWLVKIFDMWSDLAAKTSGTVAPDAEVELDRELDDVTVEAIEGDRDWNAELWISEAAETVLGREAYESLYDRFAAIPGVERLEWEDRERFLLRLRRGADRDLIRLAARRILREARPGKT
ncbi:MAG TPA: hypothetical protein VFC71_08600 [Candidatus Polarisedimenticolia bacterium]|nr:hypothetical protein [Candidatus Polarisedimenticolia bacterium]